MVREKRELAFKELINQLGAIMTEIYSEEIYSENTNRMSRM